MLTSCALHTGWGGVIGSVYFNEEFGSGTKITNGVSAHVLTASDKSTGTALGTVGIILGCTLAPFINERFGRRKAFVALGLIGIVGTLIQALSTIKHSYWTLVGPVSSMKPPY